MKQTEVICQNGELLLRRGKKRYGGLFADALTLTAEKSDFRAQELNTLQVSSAIYAAHREEKLFLWNVRTGRSLNVVLSASSSLEEGVCHLTSYVKEQLGQEAGDDLLLCRYVAPRFKTIKTQKIENIRENNLMLSPADHAALAKLPFSLFEVYNTVSKDSIVLKKSHILVDASLEPGVIRLNRKQRLWLGLELPAYLTEERWKIMTDPQQPKRKETPEEQVTKTAEERAEAEKRWAETVAREIEVVKALYGDSEHILSPDATYSQKTLAKTRFTNTCRGDLILMPVMESAFRAPRKTLAKRLSDFYVGKSTVSLVCRRPYDHDEGLDVVRMSPSNMSLLGIDEMDKVILQYRGNAISCRVLALEDGDAFRETNLPISTDLVVGVPVHLRKRLGIPDLTTAIKVDRDTGFIFRKSINEQVVPILLTLFSTKVFSDSSILVSALLSLVTIPIVLYVNLSSKRNMRA